MTITFWNDGVPYRVTFTGTIDIEQVPCGTVMLRKAGEPFSVRVSVDEPLLIHRKVEERIREAEWRVIDYAYRQAMAGHDDVLP